MGTQYDFRVDYGGATAGVQKIFRFIVHRTGIQVMLVLDISGSMGQVVTSSSSETKWVVLKNSVENFLEAYRNWHEVPNISSGTEGRILVKDYIGVVYFNHERDDYGSESSLHIFNPPHPEYEDNPSTPLDTINMIKTENNAKVINPNACTCLGGGVIAAYNAFEDHWTEKRLKHVIVFSDGLQNREPTFKYSPNEPDDPEVDIWQIKDHEDYSGGFLTSEVLKLSVSEIEKFKIHTICIGDNDLNNFMQDLSTAHYHYDGATNLIQTPEDFYYDLTNAYEELFEEILKDYSPAKVNRIQFNLERGVGEQSFIVNNTVDRIFIQTIGNPAEIQVTSVEVFKGEDTIPQKLISKSDAGINFFIHKNSLDSMGVKPGGIWTIRFSGNENAEFSTTCIVNDEYIDYDCSVNKLNFFPGEPITCTLKVKAGGKPVNDIQKAEVVILKPGEDVNDIFAKADIPKKVPLNWPVDSGSFAGQLKFEKLLAFDSAFVNKLRSDTISIKLVRTGNGTYSSAIFSNTKESGVYKFIFKFTGEDDSTGTYQRYHMLTKVIDFGESDFEKSSILVDWDFLKKKFKIRPVNKYGYLLGPDRLNNISIKLGGKKLELKDNLDGTYTAKAPIFSIFKRNQKVEVNVKSMEFFDKNYKDLK